MRSSPALVANGLRIQTLGDPHLGRRFINGVPIHRRGDREAWVNQVFADHFAALTDCDLHVNMGDIFDKPFVPPEILAFVTDTYAKAIKHNPETVFVLLKGNHDWSRDLEAVTSFDILKRLLTSLGVVVVDQQVEEVFVKDQSVLCCPFSPTLTAEEMLADITGEFTAAFGHWDVVAVGETRNLVPMDRLAALTPQVVTGHDHTPRLEHSGRLIVTGSMQPFTHGEDPTGLIYRTVTLAQLQAIPDTSKLCLRVILAEGEQLPEIDAFQVQVIKEKDVSEQDMNVTFGGLDMNTLFCEVFAEYGVSKELAADITERYHNRGA